MVAPVRYFIFRLPNFNPLAKRPIIAGVTATARLMEMNRENCKLIHRQPSIGAVNDYSDLRASARLHGTVCSSNTSPVDSLTALPPPRLPAES